ncbi:MAG: phosphotransferase [Candidatus Limnocylindria bacterium]
MPRAVKDDVARLLGSPVARAARVYGGYAPSATFRMVLADGRRAFFKGVNPDSNRHMHEALAQEEKVYRRLGALIAPWAPAFYGAFRREDWHVLLLEDVGRADVPPWTSARLRAAAHGFATFHLANRGRRVPGWVSRTGWQSFADLWRRLGALEGGVRSAAALAGRRAEEADEWIDVALPVLARASERLRRVPRPYTLLHEDARSDNVRLTRGRLRIFDWNWAGVGPAEFDAAAFAQGITADGGPEPERFLALYEERAPLRPDVLADVVASLAGYFASVAWRPPIPGLPRVRAVQRRQLKVCLPWAARLHGLPEPAWVRAVHD